MGKAIEIGNKGNTATFEYQFDSSQSIYNYQWVHNLGWAPAGCVVRLMTSPQTPASGYAFVGGEYVMLPGVNKKIGYYYFINNSGTYSNAGNFEFTGGSEYCIIRPATASIANVQAGDKFEVIFFKAIE